MQNERPPIKNHLDMMDELARLYRALESGEVEPKLAAELNNTAGKYLKAVQLELVRATIAGQTDRLTERFRKLDLPTIEDERDTGAA